MAMTLDTQQTRLFAALLSAESARPELRAWATTLAAAALTIRQLADHIDAHLTQPAQAVDVGAIREVIASHVEEVKMLRHDPESQNYLHEMADKLTAALSTYPTDKDQR